MDKCNGCFVVYGTICNEIKNSIPEGTPDGAIGIYDASIDHPNDIILEKQKMGIYSHLSWNWYHYPTKIKLD